MSKKSKSRHCRKPWRKRRKFSIKMETLVRYRDKDGDILELKHTDIFSGHLNTINKRINQRLKHYKDHGEILDFNTEFVK